MRSNGRCTPARVDSFRQGQRHRRHHFQKQVREPGHRRPHARHQSGRHQARGAGVIDRHDVALRHIRRDRSRKHPRQRHSEKARRCFRPEQHQDQRTAHNVRHDPHEGLRPRRRHPVVEQPHRAAHHDDLRQLTKTGQPQDRLHGQARVNARRLHQRQHAVLHRYLRQRQARPRPQEGARPRPCPARRP